MCACGVWESFLRRPFDEIFGSGGARARRGGAGGGEEKDMVKIIQSSMHVLYYIIR